MKKDMAVPLIGFYALITLITILFVIGVSRYNVNASLGFVVLAAVLMMSTSMFIMNEGIQLDSIESVDPETLTYNYQTVSYEVDNWNWVKVTTDVLFWGSFVAIIFGFAYNFHRSKARNVSEWDIWDNA